MPFCLETLNRLSLGVSLRAISQPLVERLGAVSFASDNCVEDIVFTAKILLTPATRSDNAPMMFHYENVNLSATVHKQWLFVGILSSDDDTKCSFCSKQLEKPVCQLS